MRAEVVLLPTELRPQQVTGRVVVVFDVLRATTSMIAALAAGAKEIRIFADLASAATARRMFSGPAVLCGEEKALPPPGFDLGNSPPAFTSDACADRTLFMSTTNGTGAILAARGAGAIVIGALVNASAVARVLTEFGMDVTLLCAGTNGKISLEDLLGCGAVLDALGRVRPVIDESDAAPIARRLFAGTRHDLPTVLRESRGGQTLIGVGLSGDIDFAARLDATDVVGRAVGDPAVVVRTAVRV